MKTKQEKRSRRGLPLRASSLPLIVCWRCTLLPWVCFMLQRFVFLPNPFVVAAHSNRENLVNLVARNPEMTSSPSPKEIFLPDKVALNTDTVYRVRTMTSLLAGVAAGILGITGVYGFLFFLVHAVLVGLAMERIACHQSPSAHFATGRKQLLSFGELTTGLLTFILVWTVTYDSIFIF